MKTTSSITRSKTPFLSLLPRLAGGLFLAACLTVSVTSCKKKDKTMVSILPEDGSGITAGQTGKNGAGQNGQSVPGVDGAGSGYDSQAGGGLNGANGTGANGTGLSELSLSPELLSKAESNAALAAILFEYDSAVLTDEMKTLLQAHLAFLDANPNLLCLLEGHTDEQGTAEYNYSLGDQRSQTVRAYLVENGIDAARLFTVSYGEDRPVKEGSGEESFAENRRVDFLVMDSEEAPAQ